MGGPKPGVRLPALWWHPLHCFGRLGPERFLSRRAFSTQGCRGQRRVSSTAVFLALLCKRTRNLLTLGVIPQHAEDVSASARAYMYLLLCLHHPGQCGCAA